MCLSYEQGCCIRGGQSLQTQSSNIEEAVSELLSMLLVQPQVAEGKLQLLSLPLPLLQALCAYEYF